jgi:cell division protein FtsQ
MNKGKLITLEDRIPKLKQQRRQRANRRLVIYVSVFFVLIIGILYFQSPYSHISDIVVKGNRYVLNEEIVSLSGLSNETSFWNVEKDKISKRIRTNEQIKGVTVIKKFPSIVVIDVIEQSRVGYAMNDGQYDPILEDGTILQSNKGEGIPADAPILMNWKSGSALQEMASELTIIPSAISSLISEIHHTPTETDPFHITLFMNDGREVSSTIYDFSKKIKAYPSIVSQIDPGLLGVIHLEVAYYFEAYESEIQNEQEEVSKNESEG